MSFRYFPFHSIFLFLCLLISNAFTAPVVAVRLDFADGPLGFNFYREILLVRPDAK